MGRYVLLEFDDNAAGEKFVEVLRTAQAEQRVTGTPLELGIIASAHSTVLAVYTKPQSLCSCTTELDNSLRGKKFGWWVCPQCKKPKDRNGQTLRNTLNPELENTTRSGSPSLIVRWRRGKDGKVITCIES